MYNTVQNTNNLFTRKIRITPKKHGKNEAKNRYAKQMALKKPSKQTKRSKNTQKGPIQGKRRDKKV